MTGTYRRTLAWTVDGVNQTRRWANSLAKIKPMSRRAKRLEHKLTTSEAVRSYYADGADDRYDLMLREMEENWYDDEPMWPIEYDWDNDTWDDWATEDLTNEDNYAYDLYDFIDDGWASYHYDDNWGSSPISVEERTLVQPEDVGRSLSDILEEALAKRGLWDPSRP